MALPVFRAATAGSSGGGSGTSITINKPAGVVSGDLLVFYISIDQTSTGTLTSVPSGWTLLDTIADASATPTTSLCYWKIAGGSEPSSYSWTVQAGGFWHDENLIAYSGCDQTTPIEVYAKSSGITPLTATGVTTSNTDLLVLLTGSESGSGQNTPAGWTQRVTNNDGNIIYEKAQTSAGASGTVSITRTNDQILVFMLALQAPVVTTHSLISASRSKFLVAAGLTTRSRSKFVSRIASLATKARSRFQVAAVLASHARSKFLTAAGLKTLARSRFDSAAVLFSRARARFSLSTGLKTLARSRFAIQFSAATKARSRFAIQFGAATRARATFVISTAGHAFISRARAVYVSRASLTTVGRAKFSIRTPLTQRARATFAIRFPAKTAARARYSIRFAAQLAARSQFRIRAGLRTLSRSRFLISNIFGTVVRPIQALFSTTSRLGAAFTSASRITSQFAVVSRISAVFTRSLTMAQPNSTTDSIMTLTYADGSSVTASAISVVVTFPDRSVQTYTMLGGDVVSAGSGKYKLTYQTKGPGIHREAWTVTDAASSVGVFQNDTEAKY